MTAYKRSYVKTSAAAAVTGLFVIVGTHLLASGRLGTVTPLINAIAWIFGGIFEAVALGGVIALYRDHGDANGRADLFLTANKARSEEVLAAGRPGVGILFRRWWRDLLGDRWAVVGDVVEVRSREEIERTLDGAGCLDGLPFMPEMANFCGRQARIFRCVDKIYDFGRSKTLRRLTTVVLLTGLRCDGSAHGGCQASCYLLWKRAWLRTVRDAAVPRGGHHAPVSVERRREAQSEATRKPPRYTCQYTQLAAASTPMSRLDLRQDLRPLLAGNVTFRAFCVAVLTRLFNEVQEARRGAGYPAPWRGTFTGTSRAAYGVVSGDRVRVLPRGEIAATLDAGSRNRGLWFDEDMIKHCGHSYRVLKRAERIIDDATGRMLEMKTPCILLEGADASGEFLRLCAQHEYPFWREIWLSPELLQESATHRAVGER